MQSEHLEGESESTSLLHQLRSKLTVFRENTAMTLFHSDPRFGSQSKSRAIDLAKFSTLVLTSDAVYSDPVSPQVKGGLDVASG